MKNIEHSTSNIEWWFAKGEAVMGGVGCDGNDERPTSNVEWLLSDL